MSHTPGPWHVVNEDTNGVQIHAAGGAFVGYAWWWMHGENLPSPAAAKANARLIASAPEMLEAIRVMLEAYQKWDRRADGGEDDLHYAATMLQSAAEAAATRQAIDGTA